MLSDKILISGSLSLALHYDNTAIPKTTPNTTFLKIPELISQHYTNLHLKINHIQTTSEDHDTDTATTPADVFALMTSGAIIKLTNFTNYNTSDPDIGQMEEESMVTHNIITAVSRSSISNPDLEIPLVAERLAGGIELKLYPIQSASQTLSTHFSGSMSINYQIINKS